MACDSIRTVVAVIVPCEGRMTTSYAASPPGMEEKENDALVASWKLAVARKPLSINRWVKGTESGARKKRPRATWPVKLLPSPSDPFRVGPAHVATDKVITPVEALLRLLAGATVPVVVAVWVSVVGAVRARVLHSGMACDSNSTVVSVIFSFAGRTTTS